VRKPDAASILPPLPRWPVPAGFFERVTIVVSTACHIENFPRWGFGRAVLDDEAKPAARRAVTENPASKFLFSDRQSQRHDVAEDLSLS
jgi:hypothetical protein